MQYLLIKLIPLIAFGQFDISLLTFELFIDHFKRSAIPKTLKHPIQMCRNQFSIIENSFLRRVTRNCGDALLEELVVVG